MAALFINRVRDIQYYRLSYCLRFFACVKNFLPIFHFTMLAGLLKSFIALLSKCVLLKLVGCFRVKSGIGFLAVANVKFVIIC